MTASLLLRALRPAVALLLWGDLPPLRAESRLLVTTNFYTLTGSNLFEVRAAMAQARPWKTNHHFDAYTEWTVRWHYRYTDKDGQYRLDTFDTHTKANVTLPRWIPPEGVPAEVVRRWVRYLQGLMTHEEGHVELARQAHAELRRECTALGSFASKQELEDAVRRTANQVMDKYRRREREYDERTRHGVAQGARLGR